MRHGSGLRKLNRTSSHRLAMLRNMTVSLLRHEEITTTLPKAKELRRMVEKLFDNLGPRYAKRYGGYLRILKTGFRKGDNAPLALVSLMDRSEQAAEQPEEKKKTEKKETAKAA